MSENPRQPRSDDAVLGGQSQAPKYAAVLGGIEGVKLRLETNSLEEKKAAIQDALKYGDKGIEVLFAVLEQEASEELQWFTYRLLEKQPSTIIKARLEKHFPWYEYESVTVNRRGEIIKRTPGRAKYYREDLENGVYLDMVYVAGGNFMMGRSWNEKVEPNRFRQIDTPQHKVTVASYWMGKYAVTQEQWEVVIGNNPSHFKGVKRPVEYVTWDECQQFCKKLSQQTGKEYRLPSEAEWEYGCRAGTITAFHTGETITTDLANYRDDDTYLEEGKGVYREVVVEVGTFPPNAFGLYEIHGNVWEWCEDAWHDNYEEAPIDGRAWTYNPNPSQTHKRVLRGGASGSIPHYCRSAARVGTFRFNYGSFRLVCLVGKTF